MASSAWKNFQPIVADCSEQAVLTFNCTFGCHKNDFPPGSHDVSSPFPDTKILPFKSAGAAANFLLVAVEWGERGVV